MRICLMLALLASLFFSCPVYGQAGSATLKTEASQRLSQRTTPRERTQDERVDYSLLTAFRINPLGLLFFGDLMYRITPVKSENPLVEKNHLGLGLTLALSPAFLRAGPKIEVQPFSFLRLWGSYEAMGYFGSFGNIQSYGSVVQDYSDTRREELRDEGRALATSGEMGTLGALLQFKLGPVAARSQLRVVYSRLKLRADAPLYYEPMFDLLVPNGGFFFHKDTDLLYMSDFGLVAGIRWTYNEAVYRDRDRRGAEDYTVSPLHRLGPFLAYRLGKQNPGARLEGITLIGIVNWWLSHPYRTGADVDTIVPYVVLAVRLSGDLLSDY